MICSFSKFICFIFIKVNTERKNRRIVLCINIFVKHNVICDIYSVITFWVRWDWDSWDLWVIRYILLIKINIILNIFWFYYKYILRILLLNNLYNSICICIFKIKNYSKYHLILLFFRICWAFSLISLNSIGASWYPLNIFHLMGLYFTTILCRTQTCIYNMR